jgi:tetratricopeptide (TPR) repeat protein
MKFAHSLLLAAGIALTTVSAFAAEKGVAFQRGFDAGRFVDEYFGLVYAADGLEEEPSAAAELFVGRLPGGVKLDITLHEAAQAIGGADCVALAKASWERDGGERTDMEEGVTPQPWARFTQSKPDALKGQHAYAFSIRGNQCFIVHAWAPDATGASADAVEKAIAGLEVKAASDTFLMAHLVARESKEDPTSPHVLARAAAIYMRDGRFKNPTLAVRAGEVALAQAEARGLDTQEILDVAFTTGSVQLAAGQQEQAIPTWKKSIELAKKLPSATEEESVAHYNLACAYSLLGRIDDAYRELETSLAVGGQSTAKRLRDGAKSDPDLANLRADARWQKLF